MPVAIKDAECEYGVALIENGLGDICSSLGDDEAAEAVLATL